MGRPLNKKYLGARNRGADGNLGAANTAGDADLGGASIASATVGTAGTYTATPTLLFSVPLMTGEGATRATGTPYFSPVAGQITVAGTATVAYLATDVITQATTGIKFTPTLATVSGNTITNTNGTSVTVTSGSYIQGTSFITGGTVTTTSGLAANTTYYVAATTSSSTTVTLASSYANAIAGTAITFTGGSTAISNGAVTIGTVAGAVYSAVYLSGSTGTINTTALAATGSLSSGAGNTIAVAQWGINNVSVTQAGNGYLVGSTGTVNITATTAGAGYGATGTSLGTITVGTSGNFTFGTAQAAGTFWVGQILTATGSISGTTWTGYTTGNNYIVTATNGTSTVTLSSLTSATALPSTAVVTTAGTVTGLTLTTGGTLTVSTVDGLVPSQAFTITGSGASSAGYSAGTYFVVAVNAATSQISLASSYANFFTSTVVSTTTTASITSTTGVGSQYLTVAVTGGNGSGGVVTAVVASEVTTGYSGRYPAMLAQAITVGSTLREDSDIIKQENYQRFKVENQDGVAYCKLIAALPTQAGQMAINAVDSAGGTYWVTKITNRRCRVTANTGTQFTSGSVVNWTFGSAVLNTSVKIDNG